MSTHRYKLCAIMVAQPLTVNRDVSFDDGRVIDFFIGINTVFILNESDQEPTTIHNLMHSAVGKGDIHS